MEAFIVPYKEILDNLSESIYFVDTERVIIYWNKAAEKVSGYSQAEVLGKKCSDNLLIHVNEEGTNLCKGLCPLAHTIKDGQKRKALVYMHHKDGHRLPVNVQTLPLKDGSGKTLGGIEIFLDKSASTSDVVKIKELAKIAFLDALTALPNSRYAEMKVNSLLHETQTELDLIYGLLLIELDNIAELNEALETDSRDTIISITAKTLAANANPGDWVCKWHDNRFLLICTTDKRSVLLLLANKLLTLLSKSSLPDNNQLQIKALVGGTILRKTDTADAVYKRLEAELAQAQRQETGSISIAEDK